MQQSTGPVTLPHTADGGALPTQSSGTVHGASLGEPSSVVPPVAAQPSITTPMSVPALPRQMSQPPTQTPSARYPGSPSGAVPMDEGTTQHAAPAPAQYAPPPAEVTPAQRRFVSAPVLQQGQSDGAQAPVYQPLPPQYSNGHSAGYDVERSGGPLPPKSAEPPAAASGREVMTVRGIQYENCLLYTSDAAATPYV